MSCRLVTGVRQRHSQAHLRAVIILNEPHISEDRLQSEWAGVQKIFRPEIMRRLALVIHRGGSPEQTLGQLSQQERESIQTVIDHVEKSALPKTRGQSDRGYDILRILINQWIRQAGPLTSRWLGGAAGCSYPTMAAALERLEKQLIRHSDRSVELKAFPEDEWFRLVANSEKVRQTLRFADASGQPRSFDSLLSRLRKLKPDGVAIPGVLGAQRLYPALDLVGTTRLDLTLHCQTGQPDTRFLRQLDPALKSAENGEPARLVIHVLRYPHRFSEADAGGILWADPVECLLDLHEMRLDSQALDFLRVLTPKKRTSP